MPKTVFILVLVFSGLFAGWTFASPPSGTIGTSIRNLFTDASGNVGIKTSAPVTLLDINGTTTIRNSLDMTSNRIINVATPVIGTNAVNKTYVDGLVGSMNATMKLWGEGRPGAGVANAAGECVNGAIKVSRSTRLATWDGSRAACPKNWWVCSASERGAGACAAATGRNVVVCNTLNPITTDDLQSSSGVSLAWVSNVGVTIASDNPVSASLLWGKMASTASGNNTQNGYTCSLLPVWCCS